MHTEHAPDVRVSESKTGLEQAAAGEIVRAARVAIADRGVFRWVLAGGETPRSVYRLLAEEPYSEAINWPRVHWPAV